MIKAILIFFLSKGTYLGFISGLFKVMLDVRENKFKWKIALSDLIGSTAMGYTVYAWAGESETLQAWQVYFITVFMSINAFVVIKIITEPDLVKKLFRTYFKIHDNEDEKKD